MTELEKTGEKLAEDFMDGSVGEVIAYLTGDNVSRTALVFLTADIVRRLDATAELIFRRALHKAATKS
jgi:hypothetical protein